MMWYHPKQGDVRVRTRFLLLPVFCGRKTYWLTIKKVKQVYHCCCLCWGWDTVEVFD